MKNYVTIFVIFVLYSCTGKDKQVTSIMLPDNMELLSGSYKSKFDGIDSEIRMIVYFDSTACSNCTIKNFWIWTGLINSFEQYNDQASIVFIFAPGKSERLHTKSMLKDYVVNYPVYIDSAYTFRKINPKINNQFFGIIDHDNNVLLSGYPFDSPNKQNQYIRILKNHK